MWKVLSLLFCLAYVFHDSLAYNNVLMTQPLYTAIFVLFFQLRICPNSSCEASECRSCLADPLVDVSVHGEVIGDSGADICKLPDGIKFVFIDGNEWGCLCVLSQNSRLLETDGESKVLAGLRKAVHQRL